MAQYHDNKKKIMSRIKIILISGTDPKIFFHSVEILRGFFFFISHAIFKCQKKIKNTSLKWTTLVRILACVARSMKLKYEFSMPVDFSQQLSSFTLSRFFKFVDESSDM